MTVDRDTIAKAAAILERVAPILEAVIAWRDARDAFDEASDDGGRRDTSPSSSYTRMQELAVAEAALMRMARELK